MIRTSREDLVGLSVVAGLGIAVALAAFQFGIPGNGEFIVGAMLGGMAAALVRPGWPGFVALAAAITLAAIVLDMSDGVFGLAWLIVASLLLPAAGGALAGYGARRVVQLGPSAAIRDPGAVRALGLAALVIVLIAAAAVLFAQNPP
jgi:hypothetical protein